MALIRGLVLDGRFDEARELVDAAMARCTAGGELFAIPELLRLKAGIVGQIIDNNPEVEAILNQAAALARTQGARAWELRTSIDLAETLVVQGRSGEARNLLASMCDDLPVGGQSDDFNRASHLLLSLRL